MNELQCSYLTPHVVSDVIHIADVIAERAAQECEAVSPLAAAAAPPRQQRPGAVVARERSRFAADCAFVQLEGT